METARAVAPLTAISLSMIVFNNLCLKFVTVASYQVARSGTTIFTILFSWLVMGVATSRPALSVIGRPAAVE